MREFIPIASILIAGLSLAVSYYIYILSSKDNSYLDIDKQYSELLKLAIENPKLRDYESTAKYYKSEDEMFKKRYNTYAFMCWNLVETIYDQQKDKKGQFSLSETWIPVMKQENRLHYTWFKKNLELFKDEFKGFVTGELNDIEITEGGIAELEKIYESFKQQFPQDERKSLEHLKKLMDSNKYKLVVANHKLFDEMIGYGFVYQMNKPNVLWLDYIAIEDIFQNSGYGTLLFNNIKESYGIGKTGIFIEVEIPNNEEQKRREVFYERLEAKKLDINYQLPTPDGKLEMNLFYRRITNDKILPGKIVKDSILNVYKNIHSDLNPKGLINEIEEESYQDIVIE